MRNYSNYYKVVERVEKRRPDERDNIRKIIKPLDPGWDIGMREKMPRRARYR